MNLLVLPYFWARYSAGIALKTQSWHFFYKFWTSRVFYNSKTICTEKRKYNQNYYLHLPSPQFDIKWDCKDFQILLSFCDIFLRNYDFTNSFFQTTCFLFWLAKKKGIFVKKFKIRRFRICKTIRWAFNWIMKIRRAGSKHKKREG